MSGIVKRIISGAIAAALSAPCLGFFPLENAVATGSQADNEALYASVLNHYAEKVIPNGIIGLDDWQYSDVWMYSTGNLFDYGYAFYDLDGNGVDELFILDNTHSTKINEIYTIINGAPKQVAAGGARWDYFVANPGNVLGELGSGGATYYGYTFYHLINGELVAFEDYDCEDGTWYYASGDNCNTVSQDSKQIISEDTLYSNHPEVKDGINIPGFDGETYLFSGYNVSDNQTAAASENVTNQCGDNVFWELDQSTGLLKISGTGPMYNYSNADPVFAFFSETDPPYSQNQGNIKSVEIQEGITSIGCRAFYGSYGSVAFKLPESLTSIGDSAFYFFGQSDIITSITIPKNVTHIGEMAVGYHWYNTPDANGDVMSVEEKIPGFTIYGYQGSAADSYAKQNGFEFVALDAPEESTEAEPESESSEDQQLETDFTKHHVGVAQLDENRSIWNRSEDVDMLYQLAEFDYYYGNTGVGFATDVYSSFGNAAEIIEAGRKSKDMYSSVSEIMYYQALLKLMYHTSEDNSLYLIQGYYLRILEEFSDQLNAADTAGNVQSLIKTTVEISEEITKADSLKKIKNALEKLDNLFEITDLPMKDYKGNSVGIGAGDILSLVAAVTELQSNEIENISDALHCVAYFEMFCDIQDDNKAVLNQLYQNAPDDNETYKTALRNLQECISTPDIESFVNEYISDKEDEVKKDWNTNLLGIAISTTLMKIAEKVPILQVVDAAGNIIDFHFDKMNSTEAKITAIGEMVCYYEIIDSLQKVGDQYKTDLIKAQNFENAAKYHEVIDLYYNALRNYCVYGNEFLSLFVSSYYFANIDKSNNFTDNMAAITKDNLVFKYIATTVENDLANDYLNRVFGISNGDYVSWYREVITLQASIKELSKHSHRSVCCEMWTDDEIDQFLDDVMDSVADKVKDYVGSRISNGKTFFIGCPVSIKIYNGAGNIIATIKNGNIAVHDLDAFMNVFCYTVEETENSEKDKSYGTILRLPDSFTFTATAQEDCSVVFQWTDAKDLAGIKLSSETWESSIKEMKKGDILQSDNNIIPAEESGIVPWKLVIIIGAIAVVAGVVIVIVITKRRKRI